MSSGIREWIPTRFSVTPHTAGGRKIMFEKFLEDVKSFTERPAFWVLFVLAAAGVITLAFEGSAPTVNAWLDSLATVK
ncbi:MAG: hypothetical protein Q8R36_02775 [bacterium]|nr:hypothetical protein [bacterium]